MTKPTGSTKKYKVIKWLLDRPGLHFTKDIALKLNVSRGVVNAALAELRANSPDRVKKVMSGRNTRWHISK